MADDDSLLKKSKSILEEIEEQLETILSKKKEDTEKELEEKIQKEKEHARKKIEELLVSSQSPQALSDTKQRSDSHKTETAGLSVSKRRISPLDKLRREKGLKDIHRKWSSLLFIACSMICRRNSIGG